MVYAAFHFFVEQKPPSISQSTLLNNKVLSAEILWAFKTVESHNSYNSCSGISTLFHRMFTDSAIAEKFTCGDDKCAYLLCFGLAPYCQSYLEKLLKSTDHYVLLFDESLNRDTQSSKMGYVLALLGSKI